MKIFNGYIGNKENSQCLHLRCGMTHLNYSLKELGKTFKLQKDLLETEMDHDEVDKDNYRAKIYEWLPYVEKDVLCTAFSYARYFKAMQEIIGFSMKDCLSVPGLGLNYFNCLGTEKDEPIFTYNDKHMRYFVRQGAYVGQNCAFFQYYKSKSCHDILKSLSEKLIVKGNVHDIIEVYLNYKNKHLKNYEKKYENHFKKYRDENTEEKIYINQKFSDFPIHHLIKQLKLIELLWDYACVSLYPSAMWDEKSVYRRIETGYAFTEDMNDELLEKFNSGNFSQGSAISKIKYYYPKV